MAFAFPQAFLQNVGSFPSLIPATVILLWLDSVSGDDGSLERLQERADIFGELVSPSLCCSFVLLYLLHVNS